MIVRLFNLLPFYHHVLPFRIAKFNNVIEIFIQSVALIHVDNMETDKHDEFRR